MKQKNFRQVVYLDNAATTFPKPIAISKAVKDCMDNWCGNSGRGAHPLAIASAEEIYRCRTAAAKFFGNEHPENVIFTMNTTHALNMAIKGILHPGDHAVCSELEHNSVWRPLWRLQHDGIIDFDIFKVFPEVPVCSTERIIASLASCIKSNTRVIICTHSSNICPVSLPVKEIGEFCHSHGIFFIVDAAQSAGILPINMLEMKIDALCVPGHKGLYAPQGCGMLILGENTSLDTLFEGGNGVDSLEDTMSEDPPERYEPGTLPTPTLSGLLHGIEFVENIGIDNIRTHEEKLCLSAQEKLSQLNGIRISVPNKTGSLLLFTHDRIPAEQIASFLAQRGICIRAGFHCAALAHRALHTPHGGAVRVSFGYFNREEHIAALVEGVKDCIESF